MTASVPNRIACLSLVAAVTGASPVHAQDFSPYFETTGRGAYDLYRDTLLCNVVLKRAIRAEPESDWRPQLEQGLTYTADFALFLLESGNVVDTGGTILTPDSLPADRQEADAAWQAILVSFEDGGEAVDAEMARCLRLYGHERE